MPTSAAIWTQARIARRSLRARRFSPSEGCATSAVSSSANASNTSPSGSRAAGVSQQALAVVVVESAAQRLGRRGSARRRCAVVAIGLLGEAEQVERGQHAGRALVVAGARVERREQAVGGRVVDVALEHLAELADRAAGIVDGVDLGEGDAVARAVGLDVEDAAVGLDRGGAIAGARAGCARGRAAAARRPRGPPCAIAACAASISSVSAWRWSPASAARRASTSAGGA